MKRYIFYVIVCSVIGFCLSACAPAGGPATGAAQLPGASPGGAITSPTGGVDPAETVYALSQTETVTQSGKSYNVTVTGYCLNFQSVDYCWDDGWQTNPGLVNYETDFWGLCNNGGAIGQCSGGTTTDPVTTPKTWSSISSYLTFPLHVASDVYTNGTPSVVNCTLSGTVLTCPDFTIDTSNANL